MLPRSSRRSCSPPLILIALAVVVSIAGHLQAARSVSPQAADQLREKIELINRNALAARPAPQRIPVSEEEVNAYLALHAKDSIPVGVSEPVVSILGDGRLAGRAIVDLDEVRRGRRPERLFDPRALLTGRLPISAAGVLYTKNGIGRFELESAEISGIPVPKSLLQDVVGYYSRTPDHPGGVSLDDPFELPARIREIEVGRGQAIVVQ